MMGRTSRRGAIVLIAAAVVATFIGLVVDARAVGAAFLAAYAFALSVVLGTMALVMIAQLTTATWFAVLRPRADRIIAALPALAVCGILLIGLLPLFRPAGAVGQARAVYLAPAFSALRLVVYWVAWLIIGESLRAAGRLDDAGETERATRRYRRTCSAGLIVLGVTMTFASFDWLMSLTPEWYSTVYGVYWFAGGVVGALALLAIQAGRASSAKTAPVIDADHLQALGKLLLTFVMFWVYIGFAQYIVIWSGNIPREVTWYVTRTHGGWGGFALVVLLAGGALPFLLLLLLRVKRSATLLAAVGGLLLAFHYADTYWVVMPGLVPMTWWTIVVSAATLILVVAAAMIVASVRHRAA